MADIGLSSGFLPKLQGDPSAREAKVQNFAQDIELILGVGVKSAQIYGERVEFGSMIAKLHIADNIRMHRDMMTKYTELSVGRENDKEFLSAWQQDQGASLAMMVADADKYKDQPEIKEQYLNGVLDYISRENAQFSPKIEKQIFNIDKTDFSAELTKINTDPKLINRATMDTLIKRGELFGDKNAYAEITTDGLKNTLNGLETNIAQIISGEGGNAFIQSVINPETGELDDVALISKFNSSMPNDLILYKRNEDGTINANFNDIKGFDEERRYAIKLYETIRGNILKTLEAQKEGTDVLAEAVNKVISESQIVKSDDYTVIMKQYDDKYKALSDLYANASPAQKSNVMDKILKFKIEKDITDDILNELYTTGGGVKLNKDFGIEDKNILFQLNGKSMNISLNTEQSQKIIKEIITGQSNKINNDIATGDIDAVDRFYKITQSLNDKQVKTLFPVISDLGNELKNGIAKKSYTGDFNDITTLIKKNNIIKELSEKNFLSISSFDRDFITTVSKKFDTLISGKEIAEIDKPEIANFFHSIYELDKTRRFSNNINTAGEQKVINNISEVVGSFSLFRSKLKTTVSNKTAIALATIASDKTERNFNDLTDEDILNIVSEKTYNYSRMFGDNTTVIRPVYAHNGLDFDDDDMEDTIQKATKRFANDFLDSSSRWTVGDISYDSDTQGNLTLTAITDGVEFTETYSVGEINKWLREVEIEDKPIEIKDIVPNYGLWGML